MCILVAVHLLKATEGPSLKKRMGYWDDKDDTVKDAVEKTVSRHIL